MARPVALRPDRQPAITGLPPHDTMAEEAVVAALLLDDDAIFRVQYLVQPADFFREQNGWCFEAALLLADRGEMITLPTLAHELNRVGRLDAVGGEPYLAMLSGKYFTAVGVEAHARIVARDALYRRMIESAGAIAQIAYTAGPEPQAALGAWQHAIDALLESSNLVTTRTVGDVVQEINEEGYDPDRKRGLTTGFRALDAMLHGFAPGEVVCIGAQTSNAKTALAIAMARRQAEQGIGIAYVPVEGDRKTLTHRMAAGLAGESLYTARSQGGWTEGMYPRYARALETVGELPIYFPDRYLSEITDIASWLTIHARQNDVRIAYIDHIDVASAAGRFGNRQAELAMMIRTLEQTARREGIVIVYLSQVNRTAKAGKMPSMGELREAGAKEEFSQIVMMLRLNERDAELDVRIAKNSEGAKGPVYRWDNPRSEEPAFRFDKQSSSIEENGAAW